jgi:hypothetical protein
MRLLTFALCLLLMACDPPPRVLVVGLDGGDWDVMEPLIEAGELPNIGALVESGVRADFDCKPAWPAFACFCPPVWTTISTGQPAGVHGYFNLGQPSSDVRVPTLWDLLAADGRHAILSSWRATYPPPPGGHTVFSESGLSALGLINYRVWREDEDEEVVWQDDYTQPSELPQILGISPFETNDKPIAGAYARDRVAMESLLRLHELPFVLRSALAETSLTLIKIDGIDKAEHVTWHSIQPEVGGPMDEDKILSLAAAWKGPLWGYPPFQFMNPVSQYKETDVWIGELMERVDYDYVLFVSDHGMDRNDIGQFSGHHHSGLPESHIGIFSLTGRGVRRDVRLETVDVHDFAPTVAYLLGLPIAEDLPGEVVTDAFRQSWLRRHPIETVPT